MKYWPVLIALLLFVIAAVYGERLYKELTMSLQVEVQEGPTTTVIDSDSTLDATIGAQIAEQLREAGLNKTSVLGDTGVSEHLQRLENKETDIYELRQYAKEIKGETEAVLMIWQSLVAGSTRINPLTNKPLFSHSIFARNNVGTMYQYDQGKKMSKGKVWGVSGFAPRFVGIPKNNDQIEHMSISMIVQMVMHEPLFALDGIEEEKLLLGHASSEEAHADMALNNAIHKEFAPYFAKNRLRAVERLRLELKE